MLLSDILLECRMLDYRSEPQPLPSSCWNPPNSNNHNNENYNNTTNTNGNIASDPLLLSDDELWKFIQTNSPEQ